MDIQFFVQANGVLAVSATILTIALLVSRYPQQQSSTVAIPVKVRKDS